MDSDNSNRSPMSAVCRLVALTIDAVIITVFVNLISRILSFVSFSFEKLFLGFGFYCFSFTLLWFVYSVITENTFSTTLGKYCLGGCVVGEKGSTLSFNVVLQRNIQKFWLIIALFLVNLISTYLQGFPPLVHGLGVLASLYTTLSVLTHLLLLFLLMMQWTEICFDPNGRTLHDKASKTTVVRESISIRSDWPRMISPAVVILAIMAFSGLFIVLNEKEELALASTLKLSGNIEMEEPKEEVDANEDLVSNEASGVVLEVVQQQDQKDNENGEVTQLVESVTSEENLKNSEAQKLVAELKNNVFYAEQLALMMKLRKLSVCNSEIAEGIAPYLSNEKEEIVSTTLDILKSCSNVSPQLVAKLRILAKSANVVIQNKAKGLLPSL